ncbi:hypothetical protein CsSME_00019338 [Camellia sinensis var. sinensis]
MGLAQAPFFTLMWVELRVRPWPFFHSEVGRAMGLALAPILTPKLSPIGAPGFVYEVPSYSIMETSPHIWRQKTLAIERTKDKGLAFPTKNNDLMDHDGLTLDTTEQRHVTAYQSSQRGLEEGRRSKGDALHIRLREGNCPIQDLLVISVAGRL